ncbi:pyroglutamyl-peptidase I [Sediminibacillus halophilus]|uniref:Pyroglutamyl-peptidase I n=1 Tax=Sediminibacillus halophilus TaxID=482461 RepID=A0A1G9RXW3_9BACI|nr:pyroglutamyl-peptidase I [Sediminibacillus halophilus]SDM28081.1 pyroglutamyl-peptidase [Sediminibacillus halophilus]
MKVLLTGFEPFLGMSENPTELVTKKLAGKTLLDMEITGHILPVDFQEASKRLITQVDKLQPDMIISLGVAAGRNRITPERIAINCMDGEPDNAGNIHQDKKIADNGPDGYFSTLPIRNLVDTLQQKGIPAGISNSAGTYLCNQIMYIARHHIETSDIDCLTGFIHMPAHHALAVENPKLPSWSLNDLTTAVEVILQELAITSKRAMI